MTRPQAFIKRSFDLVASLFGLAVLLIPGLVLALLIKLTSGGPVFYVQTRIGRHGKPFRCVKFRTMRAGSDQGDTITTAVDSRTTPIGRWLRKYKLDELPQLWNVLIGEMSLVGPRPDVPGYADKLTGRARRILDLRPGITGPATLYFRNEEELLSAVDNARDYNDNVVWPKKVALNCEYHDSWRFSKDVEYILRTIF